MGNCGLTGPKTKGDDVAGKEPLPAELPKQDESVKAIDTEEVKAVSTENNDAEKSSDDVKPVDDNKQESLEALLTKSTEEKEPEKTEEEKKPEEASETTEENVESNAKKEEGIINTTDEQAEKAPEPAITQ